MGSEIWVSIGVTGKKIPIEEAVQLLVDYLGVRYMPPTKTSGYFHKPRVRDEGKKDE